MPRPYQPDLSSPATFPDDFKDRLVRFKETSGLSWKSLAKQLGVKPHRLREWRRGVTPSTIHLIKLLGLAERLGLGEALVGVTSGFGNETDMEHKSAEIKCSR